MVGVVDRGLKRDERVAESTAELIALSVPSNLRPSIASVVILTGIPTFTLASSCCGQREINEDRVQRLQRDELLASGYHLSGIHFADASNAVEGRVNFLLLITDCMLSTTALRCMYLDEAASSSAFEITLR
jgi:hypothetical protein